MPEATNALDCPECGSTMWWKCLEKPICPQCGDKQMPEAINHSDSDAQAQDRADKTGEK